MRCRGTSVHVETHEVQQWRQTHCEALWSDVKMWSDCLNAGCFMRSVINGFWENDIIKLVSTSWYSNLTSSHQLLTEHQNDKQQEELSWLPLYVFKPVQIERSHCYMTHQIQQAAIQVLTKHGIHRCLAFNKQTRLFLPRTSSLYWLNVLWAGLLTVAQSCFCCHASCLSQINMHCHHFEYTLTCFGRYTF